MRAPVVRFPHIKIRSFMMKKIAAGIAVCVFALCSCASSGKVDEYGTVSAPAAEEGQKSEAVSSEENYSDAKIRGGKKSFSEQFFGTEKFEKIDEITLTLKTTFGNTILRKGYSIYKPHTDMAGFYVLYDTSSYAFFLAKAERNALIRAVDRYFEDFEARRLEKKAKKTERAYGSVVAYEEFGINARMLSNRSKPTVYFGYKFIGKSPYFCIFVPPTENLSKDKGENHADTVIEQRYYFTKAQARALADFLCDDSIDPRYEPENPVKSAVDEYEEAAPAE